MERPPQYNGKRDLYHHRTGLGGRCAGPAQATGRAPLGDASHRSTYPAYALNGPKMPIAVVIPLASRGIAAALVFSCPGLRAQASDGQESGAFLLPHSEAPEIHAARMHSDIRVDGRPDEAAWAGAVPIVHLSQIDPTEGNPVTERTEVRFLYDDDALYVGGALFDSRPVTTRLARRDSDIPDSDFFVVLLDSYHDHQTA